jgi:hypothetical protein
MRFHVPNNEVDQFYEERQKEKEKKGSNKNNDEEDSEEPITASQMFSDKILAKTNIG